MRYQDLKVGMKVKIVCVCNDYHTDYYGHEWNNVWVPIMDSYVGESFVIDGFELRGVWCSDETDSTLANWCWPWESLEEISE